MEEFRCAAEDLPDGPDPKLKIIARPVEEEEANGGSGGEEEENGGREEEEENGGREEENGGREEKEDGGREEEEENGGRGDTADEEDSDEEYYMYNGWDENGDPYLPFLGSSSLPDLKVCPLEHHFTMEEAEKIVESVSERDNGLLSEWFEMFNNNITPLTAMPLRVLPFITTTCVSRRHPCYHARYWTQNTSETAPDHPYFRPCPMMQVFSLGLSSPLTRPVNIYGCFSVRDNWEPLRNYQFNRSRDDPAVITQGCSFLPLCSPCRGIFVEHFFLIDVDLWIKEEGGGPITDKPLFRGCVEIDTCVTIFESDLKVRFQGECHGLDMQFALLRDGIETVIEVKAEAKQPSDVRISASTSSGFGSEILLYDGKFCGSGSMFKHIMAVKKKEELHIVLEMDDSRYKWTFKAGVGVIVAPEHPVSGFTQYFVMNVSFRTRGKAASAWQWSCICNDVRVSKMYL